MVKVLLVDLAEQGIGQDKRGLSIAPNHKYSESLVHDRR